MTSGYDFDTVQNTVLENIDWEVTRDLAKAKLFAEWGSRLLAMMPESASHEGNALTSNTKFLEDKVNQAMSFVRSQTSSNQTRFLSAGRSWR